MAEEGMAALIEKMPDAVQIDANTILMRGPRERAAAIRALAEPGK